MKLRSVLIISSLIYFGSLNAQILISQDFTGYDGTAGSISPGWHFSWNSTSSPSYYSSGTYSGVNIPSYKFGVTQDTIITPGFSQADTLSFWVKGSSTFSVDNTLDIYTTIDSLTWSLLFSIDSLPQTGTTFKFPVPNSARNLKFIYTKVTGNMAIDDIIVYKGLLTAIENLNIENEVLIFPNPGEGKIALRLSNPSKAFLKMFNIKGELLLEQPIIERETFLDLSNISAGSYFIQIISDAGVKTKKLILTN